MGVSKVILNGSTLIDVTNDTVDSSTLLTGYSATRADGEKVYGDFSPEHIVLQEKTNIIPIEINQTIVPDEGYTALSSVGIKAVSPYYIGSAIERRFEEDVTVEDMAVPIIVIAPSGYYEEDAVIEISHIPERFILQDKTDISPLAIPQTITPDQGYDALSSVQINGIDPYYIGPSINRRDSEDINVVNDGVFIPEGYYETSVEKTVERGSVSLPYTEIEISPRVTLNTELGQVTVTGTASETIYPIVLPGYVDDGDEGLVSVSLSNTTQLPTKGAETITPGTTDKTIQSGVFLTEAQTIKGDSDLIAENIKSGVNIFGVQGSYSGLSVIQNSITKVLSIS